MGAARKTLLTTFPPMLIANNVDKPSGRLLKTWPWSYMMVTGSPKP
jgi:hypothetical protein